MSRAPISTYRLQLRPGFGFDEAAAEADYLALLGATHVYCSPYLQAARGSTHGYDVVDHSRVNQELGGEEGHVRMCEALGRAGLGQVLDIVPNHMAITSENRWWWDVLENGPASVYASYFDVSWESPEAKLRDTVLMPILADHYGRVLEAAELRLERRGGSFVIRYQDHVLPVAPRSIDGLLTAAAMEIGSDELAFIAHASARLPLGSRTDPTGVHERHRDKEVLRRELARLCDDQPAAAEAIDRVVERVNGDPEAMDELLERQNYRMAFWRTAGQELDYRRFFDIDSLVGLRMEDGQVFADTHELVLGWIAQGVVDGLRVDHPDGLRDPEAYFRRLHDVSGGTWVVAEKILEAGEGLRETWPVAGTTGYDFLAVAGGLFVDPAGEEPITELYGSFTNRASDYHEVAYEKKHLVLREGLAADVNRLTEQFVEVCEGQRRYRDFTRHELREALQETVACFPVYRTYVRMEGEEPQVSQSDVDRVSEAVGRAVERRPDIDPELFEFLKDLLLLRVSGESETELALRFQQLTGPAMAKGVEDTAFYEYCRLVSLNDVGGDPAQFGVGVDEFHAHNAAMQPRWPTTMLATSTHDTKRSEDVRSRLALLSEMPDQWADAVWRWSELVDHHWPQGWPDRNAQYLLFQTLVGAWPLPVERAVAYMAKAAKEAKEHTSWTRPDTEYDDALRTFVERAVRDEAFAADLESFVSPLVWPGRVTSVALQLLKLTSPGVPDVYQGTELWDLSLVDPDNRRPVDFGLRRKLLEALEHMGPEEVLARADEGLPKLWVTRQGLRLRRLRPDLFGPDGSYEPLEVGGGAAAHAVAFSRGGGAATIVPRLALRLRGEWSDTTVALPGGRWRNLLTDEQVEGGERSVGELLARFPVALLMKEGT